MHISFLVNRAEPHAVEGEVVAGHMAMEVERGGAASLVVVLEFHELVTV